MNRRSLFETLAGAGAVVVAALLPAPVAARPVKMVEGEAFTPLDTPSASARRRELILQSERMTGPVLIEGYERVLLCACHITGDVTIRNCGSVQVMHCCVRDCRWFQDEPGDALAAGSGNMFTNVRFSGADQGFPEFNRL